MPFLLSPNRDITYLDMKNVCCDIGEFYKRFDTTYSKCHLEFKNATKHFIAIGFNNIDRKDYKGLRISNFQYPLHKQNFTYNFFKVDENYNIVNDDNDVILKMKVALTKKSYGLRIHLYEHFEFSYSSKELEAITKIFLNHGLKFKKSNAYKETIITYG